MLPTQHMHIFLAIFGLSWPVYTRTNLLHSVQLSSSCDCSGDLDREYFPMVLIIYPKKKAWFLVNKSLYLTQNSRDLKLPLSISYQLAGGFFSSVSYRVKWHEKNQPNLKVKFIGKNYRPLWYRSPTPVEETLDSKGFGCSLGFRVSCPGFHLCSLCLLDSSCLCAPSTEGVGALIL